MSFLILGKGNKSISKDLYPRKRFFNKGTRLEFTLDRGKEEGTYKAMQVKVLPKGGEEEGGSSSIE